MSVKDDVLKKLEGNRGKYFSGEKLAAELSVTRAAVWKAIHRLEDEGYPIEGIPNRGYQLAAHTDILSVHGIRTGLLPEYKKINIQVMEETHSTNQDAKQAAAKGCAHGTLFVAEKQSRGKGRRGKSFVSLKGSGIYMSLVLRPVLCAPEAVYLTTAASVAVYRAIEKVTGKVTGIKWVNDIYYEGKKICGILTEAVSDCETGMVDSIILGIGINFKAKEEDYPANLREIVGALYQSDTKGVSRNQLISEVINQVRLLCDNIKDTSFLKEYREHSIIIGSEILIIDGTEQIPAFAQDIDETGALVVRLLDKSVKKLTTGEVSIRKFG